MRLQTLAVKEEELQKRVAEMQGLVATDGQDTFVQLRVCGQMFETTIGNLTYFPHSVLATIWHNHRKGKDPEGPVRVNGDPSLFHLILEYLRCPGKLPIIADASQLQWLERQGEYYGFIELRQLCRDASKSRNTFQVVQLLTIKQPLWHEHAAADARSLHAHYSNCIDFRGASM